MKHLLNEMQAFLEGRDSSFTTVLPNLPTSQIEQLNQYLTVRIGDSAQVHAMSGLTSVTLGRPAEAVSPNVDTGTALSGSDLADVKLQIDQQLSTIRTELQSVFGLLPDTELARAATQFDDLSMVALVDGAKRSTLSVMDVLESQQATESSLVDDVWMSMGQVMHSDSLVTSGIPLDDLFHGWYLSSVSQNPLFGNEMGNPQSPVAVPDSRDDNSVQADSALIDLMHAAVLLAPVIPAGHPGAAVALGEAQQTPQPLLSEDIFRPLSTSTNAGSGQPAIDTGLDKFA